MSFFYTGAIPNNGDRSIRTESPSEIMQALMTYHCTTKMGNVSDVLKVGMPTAWAILDAMMSVKPNVNITIDCFNNSHIQRCNNGEMPNELNPENYADKQDELYITFIKVERPTKILDIATKVKPEERKISLALQENIHHKIKVWVSTNSIVVASNKITGNTVRQVIAMLPTIFQDKCPQLFNKNFLESEFWAANIATFLKSWPNHDSTVERRVVNATVEEDKAYDDFSKNLDTYLQTLIDFKGIRQESLIKFLHSSITAKLQRAKNDYTECNSTLQELYIQVRNQLKNLEHAGALINGLENTPNADAKDLVDYLETNKAVTQYQVISNDKILLYQVITTMEYFDPDLVAASLRHDGAREYQIFNDAMPHDAIRQFFTDLFIEPKWQIFFEADIAINLREKGCNITNMLQAGHHRGGGGYYNSNMPHDMQHHLLQPHLANYDCWGNNGNEIYQCLKDNNIIGAIEQTIAACKNLNTGDGAVMEKFIYALAQHRNDPNLFDPKTETWHSIMEVYNPRTIAKKEAPSDDEEDV